MFRGGGRVGQEGRRRTRITRCELVGARDHEVQGLTELPALNPYVCAPGLRTSELVEIELAFDRFLEQRVCPLGTTGPIRSIACARKAERP